MAKENLKNLYPSDWKEYKFDKLFDFEGGLSISRANLSNVGICYLHYGDIHKSDDNYIDIEKSYDLIPKYNESLNNINRKFLLNDGDIVFADASEDYEGIGKSVVVINPKNIPFISGLHTIVAKDKSNLLNNGYKRFFLLDWNIRKQMMLIATGISVYGISKNKIKNVKVYLPPIEEQQKISSILSTWDKAIELKEKLIEQKKEQKKGLMQKLLTGEVRLPGFEGEWGKFKIKEVCNVVSGGTPSTNDKKNWDGNIPWCTPTDITSSGKFIRNTKQTITEKGLKNSSANLLPKNSILMCSRATIGPRSINRVEMATNQGFKSFVCNEEYLDYEFFYYLLSIYIPIFKKLASGSTFLEVSKKDVENTKIFIPKDVKEQKAIGSIIGNLDKTIELLEEETKELKQQKKGLMQLLLTGKVRVQV